MRIGPTSATYDFRNISADELRTTVNGLIKSGELDLDETSPLVGMMGGALSVVGPGAGLPAASPTDTGSVRFDVFARLQQGIDSARYFDDRAAERFWQSAVSALERFQDRPTGLDVTA